MALNPRKHYSTKSTPQSQPIPGAVGQRQAKNNAGGYAFTLDDWAQLGRYLMLGSEGGTYYVSEQKLTVDNANCVARCAAADGPRTVNRIVEVSGAGRAPKNDPALFALALCASAADVTTRQLALQALPLVARTGTHLFHFVEYVEGQRGWGRSLKRAIADWYLKQDADRLALQVVKYKQRDGWSHRDLLRLSHPLATTDAQRAVFDYVCKGVVTAEALPDIIKSAELLPGLTDLTAIKALILGSQLPREVLPTELLNKKEIWQALLPNMPLHALVRNLGKLTSVGALAPLSAELATVLQKLDNEAHIKKSRLHPLALLMAQKVYEQGKGDKGKLTWDPLPPVVDALDGAFYRAFQNVVPTGKRVMLALDVSGSMTGGGVAGSSVTPRAASAALALVQAATEKPENTYIMGFSGGFIPLKISPRQRLADVVRYLDGLPFDSTDCALPMYHALDKGLQVDAFVVYTDNETWVGQRGHPVQALEEYRDKTGINAKLVVCGMTATNFTIADPKDPGMLDVVGFDTAAPAVIADFIRE